MSERTVAKRKLEVVSSDDPWPGLWASFERSMDAGGKAKRTRETYRDASDVFLAFMRAHNLPTDPAQIKKEHVERFLIWLRDERDAKPATVRMRFSALRRFFNWLVEEGPDNGGIEFSPMARMKGPKVEEEPTQPLTLNELQSFLNACRGGRFEDKRDRALLRLMFDSGLRRSEVANIMVEDLNLKDGLVGVTRKGGRREFASFGKTTIGDLDRYMRARDRHPSSDLVRQRDGEDVHPLWLAQKGQLTSDGVHFVVVHRAKDAGIERRVWPHLMRHTFAHHMKVAGASDEDLMTAGGWRDRKMMMRYGAGQRAERAHKTVQRLSLGDRLR